MAKDKKDIPVTEEAASAPVAETGSSSNASSENDKKPYNYSYTKASASDNKKGTSYVEVQKTDNEVSENQSVFTTTIKENKTSKNEKKQYSNIVSTTESYSVNSGYKKTETSFEDNNEYYSQDRLKNYRHTHSEYTSRESGASSEAMGYQSSATYGETTIHSGELNKQGVQTKEEYHHFVTSPISGSRSDTKIIYDKKTREQTKQVIHADATLAELTVNELNNKKQETFYGKIKADGSEIYQTTENNKAIDVEVSKDGTYAGVKYTIQNGEVQSKKELTKKEVKKQIKKDRERTDRIIKRIGDANQQEYLAAIPSPTQIGNPGKVGDIFNQPLNKSRLDEIKEQKEQEYTQRIEKNKRLTAEQIAQQRLQELRGR